MSGCDICGKDLELFRVRIEGSLVNACENCSRFGYVISHAGVLERNETGTSKTTKNKIEEEIVEFPVENLGDLIENHRGKMNLSQKELALKLNEKESIIQKIENDQIIPDVKLINKLEKFFHVKLTEKNKIEKVKIKNEEAEAFTLADFIKR